MVEECTPKGLGGWRVLKDTFSVTTIVYDLTDMSEECPELSLSNMSDEAYELENDTNLNNYSDYIINELCLRSKRHFDALKK